MDVGPSACFSLYFKNQRIASVASFCESFIQVVHLESYMIQSFSHHVFGVEAAFFFVVVQFENRSSLVAYKIDDFPSGRRDFASTCYLHSHDLSVELDRLSKSFTLMPVYAIFAFIFLNQHTIWRNFASNKSFVSNIGCSSSSQAYASIRR